MPASDVAGIRNAGAKVAGEADPANPLGFQGMGEVREDQFLWSVGEGHARLGSGHAGQCVSHVCRKQGALFLRAGQRHIPGDGSCGW